MSGYEVDQHIQVEFLEGRDRDSLKSRPGWLGVGHDERGAIFGEVFNADIGVPSFTVRCYRVDEYLDLDRMRTDGLVLDAGSSGNMVLVPGTEIAKATSQLRKPVAALGVGEQVTVLRNPEHPAWKDVVEGEYGRDYVLPEDFDPLVGTGVQITDRQGGKVRAENSFWYRPDGKQDGSGSTIVVSEHALDGTRLPVEIDEPEREQSAAASGPVSPKTEDAVPDRFDRSVSGLSERIETFDGVLQQLNPHSEKMQPRIRQGSRLLTLAKTEVDHFTGMTERHVDPDLLDEAEIRSRRDGFAGHLEQTSVELEQGMKNLGVQVPRPRTAPGAGHSERLAALKSAAPSFAEPVPAHDGPEL